MMWTCGLNCHFTYQPTMMYLNKHQRAQIASQTFRMIFCVWWNRWLTDGPCTRQVHYFWCTYRLTTSEEQVCPRDTKHRPSASVYNEWKPERKKAKWEHGNNFSKLVGEILGTAGKSFALFEQRAKSTFHSKRSFNAGIEVWVINCSRDATVPLTSALTLLYAIKYNIMRSLSL